MKIDDPTLLVVQIVASVAILVFFVVFGEYLSLYVQARLSHAPVGFLDIIRMRFRRVDVRTVVYTLIRCTKAGLSVQVHAIETHYLAGGDVPRVAAAIIMAQKAKERLSWETACAMDLAGKDVIEVVENQLRKRGKHPEQNPTPVEIEVREWTSG
jgi:uncharacterized protein YqfA (UPF0365 family)